MTDRLSLVCTYKTEEDELEIVGKASSLQALVAYLNEGQSKSISLLAAPFSGFGGQLLSQLEIQVKPGKVAIDSNNGRIIISGSSQALHLFAISVQNLYAPSDSSKFSSKHCHMEYFPEHPFLALNSKSLLIYFANDNTISDSD